MRHTTTAARYQGKSVVILEDDHPTEYLYRLLLERTGFTVTCFTENQRCRDYLRHHMPDLLICDIFCDDEEDGLAFLAGRCDEWGARQPPVIVASAIADYQFAGHPVFQQLIQCEIMPKPFDIDALGETVDKIFDQRSLARC